MYILASDLFRKKNKYIFKATNSFQVGEFINLERYIYVFY